MKTDEFDRLLDAWIGSAEEVTEPGALLPSVFAVTRTLGQRRGFIGRLAGALRSGTTVLPWETRPVFNYAVLVLLLLTLLIAAAVAGGLLRPPIPTGWRALDQHPPAGEQTIVSSIISTDAGFLAIGSSIRSVEDVECGNDLVRGRVWSSTNGDSWTDLAGSSLVGAQPQRIVASGTAFYAFGQNNYCGLAEPGIAARGWRSIDGATWEQLPDTEMLSAGNIPYFADIDGTLIAVGIYQVPPVGEGEYGPPETRVWSSTDGTSWDHLDTLDGITPLGLTEKDGVLVLLGWPDGAPVLQMLYSTDRGRTWAEAERPSGLPESIFAVAADGENFVAVGDEVALASTDGRTWSAATSDPAALEGVVGLTALTNGFMVVRTERSDGVQGQECRAGGLQPAQPSPSAAGQSPNASPVDTGPTPVPTDYCFPVDGTGGTSTSLDGREWHVGPDLPLQSQVGLPIGYVIGAGRGALLVADPTHFAMVWYAPLDDFQP